MGCAITVMPYTVRASSTEGDCKGGCLARESPYGVSTNGPFRVGDNREGF